MKILPLLPLVVLLAGCAPRGDVEQLRQAVADQAKAIERLKTATPATVAIPPVVGRFVLFEGKDVVLGSVVSPQEVMPMLYRIDTTTGKTWRYTVARGGGTSPQFVEGWEELGEKNPWTVLRSLPQK